MDNIGWIILGIVVVAAVVGLIVWLLRRRNDPYAEYWAPIAPLVEGKPSGNKMAGRYAGMPLEARIENKGNEKAPKYIWELELTPGARGKDWSIQHAAEGFLGTGEKKWQIKTKDEALKRRLLAAGALGGVDHLSHDVTLDYDAGDGTLTSHFPVPTRFNIPGPDEFRLNLDLLQRYVEMNKQANVVE